LHIRHNKKYNEEIKDIQTIRVVSDDPADTWRTDTGGAEQAVGGGWCCGW